MVKDKNLKIMKVGDYVLYKGKVWKFEKQMSGHVNLRNTKNDLVSVKAHDVEFHNGPTMKDIAAVAAEQTVKSSIAVESITESSVIELVEEVKKKEQEGEKELGKILEKIDEVEK